MKKILIIVILILSFHESKAQGVGINNPTPDPSAILDIKSTSMGLLPPRMTTLERNAIPSPAVGLIIYNLDDNCINYYNGSTWLSLCGNANTTSVAPKDSAYEISTTWVKPAGLKYIVVELVGGGGGGGGCYNYSGGAGAGGGYSRKIIPASALGVTETIVIGSGGAGGGVQLPGANGGTTSFGSHCSATGGEGGKAQTSTVFSSNGSVGGIGVGGNLNINGQGTVGAVGPGSAPGSGGSSFFGGGARNAKFEIPTDGFSAGAYGAGGSGGTGGSMAGGNKIGGNGSNGVVFITEYY